MLAVSFYVFFTHPKIVVRIQNILFPLTLSILILTIALLYHASSFQPYAFQIVLIALFFLFYPPSKTSTPQSTQFEVWLYFFLSTILPLSFFVFSSFSQLKSTPLSFTLQLILLSSTPASVFLGLLSFRYFSWARRDPKAEP